MFLGLCQTSLIENFMKIQKAAGVSLAHIRPDFERPLSITSFFQKIVLSKAV